MHFITDNTYGLMHSGVSAMKSDSPNRYNLFVTSYVMLAGSLYFNLLSNYCFNICSSACPSADKHIPGTISTQLRVSSIDSP